MSLFNMFKKNCEYDKKIRVEFEKEIKRKTVYIDFELNGKKVSRLVCDNKFENANLKNKDVIRSIAGMLLTEK